MARGTPDWWKRAEALISMDFIQLKDTPGSYAGQAGKGLKVTALVDGLEFADTDIDAHAARHENGGADEIDLAGMTPAIHAARHENGGADEIDVTGLSGELADAQPCNIFLPSATPIDYAPYANKAVAANATEDGLRFTSTNPDDHAARHENGGADEIDIAGMIIPSFGTFTRSAALASGNQTISGLPFRPSHVEFLAVIAQTSAVSIGFDNAVNHYCIKNNHQVNADAWDRRSDKSIHMQVTNVDYYDGYISSFTDDGYVVTWTKTNNPVGTITIFYKAHK